MTAALRPATGFVAIVLVALLGALAHDVSSDHIDDNECRVCAAQDRSDDFVFEAYSATSLLRVVNVYFPTPALPPLPRHIPHPTARSPPSVG